MIDLPSVIAKSEGADFLRGPARDSTPRLMDIEMAAVCNAKHGGRGPDRENQRNGYRPRQWNTRAGTIGRNIPKPRKGSQVRAFLEPRRTAEKARTAVIQEADIHGVSRRAVDDLVRAKALTGLSQSEVLQPCEEIDKRVRAFQNRPQVEGWPFLGRDAAYVTLREDGHASTTDWIVTVRRSCPARHSPRMPRRSRRSRRRLEHAPGQAPACGTAGGPALPTPRPATGRGAGSDRRPPCRD